MSSMKPEFTSAVEKEDIPYLRSYIASTIINDPTFNKGTCDNCMAYLNANNLDITEPYELNITEEPTPTDKSLWDKRLFLRKVEYLRKNFAYEKRIGEIREIGRVVYADESAEQKANFEDAPKGRRSDKKNSSLAMIIGAVVAIATIIAIITFLVKK